MFSGNKSSLFAIVATTAMSMVPAHSQAESDLLFTGNTLLNICQSEDSALEAACTSYFVGLTEGLKLGSFNLLFRLSSNSPTVDDMNARVSLVLGYCAPNEVTYGQYIRIAIKHLEDHPEILHEPVRTYVLRSWQEAFPCSTE